VNETDRVTTADVTCLCAWLRMATRATARVYDEALRPAGLRTTQFSLLARLDVDGPATLSRLADRLAIDRTTLRRELDPLHARGLVAFDTGADRRCRVVSLTPVGADRLAAAYPLWRQAQREVRARLGRERIERLLVELDAVVGATRDETAAA
jgi:DNA-binding MarR family transcriptional regulator